MKENISSPPIPLQPLEILKYVNEFYSDSFINLITLFGILCGLVGVVIPILFWVVQKRFFKAENQEIKNTIHKELREEYNLEIKKISEEYKEKESVYEKRIFEIEKELTKKIEKVSAGVYYIQGNMILSQSGYVLAFTSYLKAGKKDISCNNDQNLNQVIKRITRFCLPNIKQVDLKNADEDLLNNYNAFLKELTQYDTNGRYSDDIKLIKSEYKQAQKRL
jgi:cell division protein YceG involved in septum cleavage